MEMCYQVFVNATHHLVLPDSECSFETCENLESAGFRLIWDSAPTKFEGAKYAAVHYGAVLPVNEVRS